MPLDLAASTRQLARIPLASITVTALTPQVRPPPLPSIRVASGSVDRDESTEEDEWKLRAAYAEARRRIAERAAQASAPAAARRARTLNAPEREWEVLNARALETEEREWDALRARVCASEEREWQALRARAHASSLREREHAAQAATRAQPLPPAAEQPRVVFWP